MEAVKKIDRAALKKMAKGQLKGNWGWAVCLTLVSAVILGILNGWPAFFMDSGDNSSNKVAVVLDVFGGILGGLITAGIAYTYLKFVDRKEKANVFSGVFAGFTKGRFIPTFLTTFLTALFAALWTLLLIIPGIIKYYSYAMAPYILKDLLDAGKEPAPTEAISKSKELMNGHKWELFVLELSFIGWYLLGFVTLGIGLLWVVPYYNAVHADYYRALAGDQFKN
ncbi:DUF975 family protein [Lactobacillus porci]|uniref:DUF975 family protein n=2 Tax=Lactobacillus TaxID=1578 RepID=UPI003995748E